MNYKPKINFSKTAIYSFEELKTGDTFICLEENGYGRLFQVGEFTEKGSMGYVRKAGWDIENGKEIKFNGSDKVIPCKVSITIDS